MKTILSSFLVVALMTSPAFAQSAQSKTGGCKCSDAKTAAGQSSCCADKKPGTPCACSAKTTSLDGILLQQADTSSNPDALQIAVQKICPVSGGSLGAMGDPVKVTIDEQTLFLCCKGCEGKPAHEEHWNAIQANFANAQGTCPVMGKPVDADMKSTIVDGERVFVCCPPCRDKIQADPGKALSAVHTSYATFVKAETQAKSDQIHIAAQGICPVSGQKLGSMGAPVKVKLGEEHGFLCCKGCEGKSLDKEHWGTVQANLARAQGTCPVMGKAVTAEMKSTVVNGRRIFVCCLPCIEKIQEDPATFVAKLDQQITSRKHAEAHQDGDHSHDGHDHR